MIWLSTPQVFQENFAVLPISYSIINNFTFESLPANDPTTGHPFTEEGLIKFNLQGLKPVSPWYPITLPIPGSITSCRSPDYVKDVGTASLIYIYRLVSDHSICYIGSAENGTKRFTTHREHCSSFLRGTYPINGGCRTFYSMVRAKGWQSFEIAVLAYCNIDQLTLFENAWLSLAPTLNFFHYEKGKVK